MELMGSLGGMICLEVTSANVVQLLAAANEAGIPIFHAVSEDDLTARLHLRRQDLKKLKLLLERRGEMHTIKEHIGVFWRFKRLLKRPVLLAGIALLLTISCYLPTRIWFIRVEGNERIPANQILEQAQLCGISYGASRRDVRSEKMKNALLQALPQLQWAGVNTKGCVATISVREREAAQSISVSGGVSRIVAACDGLILSCTVTKGSASCAVGQAVRAGDLLISGYTDCGLSIRANQAEGEIFARTEHLLTVVAPLQYRERTEKQQQIKKYSLIIGKKRINFYKDSGILDASCVKMVSEKNLTLPGGYILPITLVTEVWETYSDAVCTSDTAISEFAADYLNTQMIAGQILSAEETITATGELVCMEGKYACREMIGRVQNEEIIKPNGND